MHGQNHIRFTILGLFNCIPETVQVTEDHKLAICALRWHGVPRGSWFSMFQQL